MRLILVVALAAAGCADRGFGPADAIEIDGDYLYWCGDAQAKRAPLAGGDTEALGTVPRCGRLAGRGGTVLVAGGDGLYRCDGACSLFSGIAAEEVALREGASLAEGLFWTAAGTVYTQSGSLWEAGDDRLEGLAAGEVACWFGDTAGEDLAYLVSYDPVSRTIATTQLSSRTSGTVSGSVPRIAASGRSGCRTVDSGFLCLDAESSGEAWVDLADTIGIAMDGENVYPLTADGTVHVWTLGSAEPPQPIDGIDGQTGDFDVGGGYIGWIEHGDLFTRPLAER